MLKPRIPDNEIERLKTLHNLQILDTPPEERFDRLTRLASTFFKVPTVLVSLVDKDRQWFKSRCGLDATETSRDISFCGHTILRNEPLIVQDALDDERFSDNPLVTGELHLRFYAGHPIKSPNGHVLGSFCLIDYEPHSLSDEEIGYLSDFAELVEEQIRHMDVVDLHEELKHASSELSEAYRHLEKHNDFVRSVFGAHMTGRVVDTLLESPGAVRLGGEVKHLTLLMTDMRDFTRLSQQLSVQDLLTVLNRYLSTTIDLVDEHGGIVDQIMGDGILAYFGLTQTGEDYALSAARCAVAIQKAVQRVNAENLADGFPEIGVGIGIHSGDVVIGNIGSERRMKYSVIGNAVNLTSRIESMCLPGQTLISEDAVSEAGPALQLQGQIRMKLRGVQGGVTVHDLKGIAES